MKKNIRKCETTIKKRIDEDNKEELIDNKETNEEATEKVIEDIIDVDNKEELIIEEPDSTIDETIDSTIEEEPIIEEEEEELRIEQEGDAGTPTEKSENIIEGYAIVFNSLSEDLGGFREIITQEAISQELINRSNVYYLYNHNDDSIPLARSNKGEGSLSLSIDGTGLKYSFDCLNHDIYNSIKRGDINKASFAFSLPVDGSGEIWEKSNEYNYIRKIINIEQLFDLSCVLIPAYQSASVYARSIINKELDENYYIEYDNIIKSLIQ